LHCGDGLRFGATMTDPTRDFFEGLRRRGHDPLLGKASGSLRFELTNGSRTERWLVTVDRGDLTISRRAAKADCTVRAPKQVFDRIATGQLNAMASLLRGALVAEGDPTLMAQFQRVFPSPPRTRDE
jgi:putative sterol carrier protein